MHMRTILGLAGCAVWLGPRPAAAQWPAPPPTGSVSVAELPPGTPPPTPGTSTPAASDPAPGQPPAGSGQPAATDPYGQPVTAGGLSAPPPMDPNATAPPAAAPGETEQQLDQAEEEDSGRGLTWFWLDLEGGYQYVGLETFTVDTESLSAGFEKSDASGGYVGAGLGVQLLILRIGPRFRVGFFREWQLYSIDGEVGFRIPIGSIEPHVEVAAGYSALGSFAGVLSDVPDSVRIDGFNVRLGGGLDFFPSKYLSLGGVFSWEVLGMTRPGVDVTALRANAQTDAERAQADLLAAEGSGYGTSITIGGRLGLHF
jgi:hypothetical protein